jgi:hypothetical protein
MSLDFEAEDQAIAQQALSDVNKLARSLRKLDKVALLCDERAYRMDALKSFVAQSTFENRTARLTALTSLVDVGICTLTELREAVSSATRPTVSEQLHETANRDRLQKVYPFMKDRERAQQWLDSVLHRCADPKKDREQLTSIFIERCKNKSLTPHDISFCDFALFHTSPETALLMLTHLILEAPVDQRVKLHNWYMVQASNIDESWVLTNGEAIARAELPLFPLVDSLRHLNNILFESTETSGGSTRPGHLPNLYENAVDYLGRTDVISGGTRHTVYNESNQVIGYTDTEPMEAALREAFADLRKSIEISLTEIATRFATQDSTNADTFRSIQQLKKSLLVTKGRIEATSQILGASRRPGGWKKGNKRRQIGGEPPADDPLPSENRSALPCPPPASAGRTQF